MPPSTMRALLQTGYGDPASWLSMMTVPLPAFNETSDNLLIAVKAASVNPLDYVIVKGALKALFKDPMPCPVGVDLSGVVVRAGKATGFKEGDEVFGGALLATRGSMAEYCVVPAANCCLKPKSLSHEEAACLPVVGLTALQAFKRHKGSRGVAFIPAGLGGVGSIALQLAKPWAGFERTITTVSTSKVQAVREHVKDLDQVVDYKTTDPGTVIGKGSCDFVLDSVGPPGQYVRFMRKPSPSAKAESKPSIICISAPPPARQAEEAWGIKLPFMIRLVLNGLGWWTRLWMPGWVKYDSFGAIMDRGDLKILSDLADEGRLRPVIWKVFPLEKGAEAFLLAQQKPAGKVVVKIGE